MAALHGDVASAIGQQVEQMIVQAQKDSEARVRHELSNARTQLQQMESVIGDLTQRVSNSSQRKGGALDTSQYVDRDFLNHMISQLETKWSSEAKALKQDLHRTILAHNHNSDLMRHHRDTLDEARRKLDANMQPKAEQVDAQIEKIDRMLRAGQAKQRALDALTERLTALEHQVELFSNPYQGMMPPGMPGAGMPPGMEGEIAAALKRGGKKEEPTDEDIRAKLAGTSLGQSGETSPFNASAPVFIPSIEGSSVPTDVGDVADSEHVEESKKGEISAAISSAISAALSAAEGKDKTEETELPEPEG